MTLPAGGSIQYDGVNSAAEYTGSTLVATTLSIDIDQFIIEQSRLSLTTH
jgi:hypothetical protein